MSQLVRLEGKHSTQNAHCALVETEQVSNFKLLCSSSPFTQTTYLLPPPHTENGHMRKVTKLWMSTLTWPEVRWQLMSGEYLHLRCFHQIAVLGGCFAVDSPQNKQCLAFTFYTLTGFLSDFWKLLCLTMSLGSDSEKRVTGMFRVVVAQDSVRGRPYIT